MIIPLKLSLLGDDGNFLNLYPNKMQKESLLILRRRSQKFTFKKYFI